MDRSRVAILTIAGIGGAASSLLDLAATLTRGEPWSFGPGYFLGAVEPTPVGQISLFRIVPSVHARTDSASPMQDASEERRAGTATAREKDILKIRLRKKCPDCVVVWTVNGEQRRGRVEELLSDDDVVSIEAAPGATRFGIWNMQINPKMWVVPSDGARTYEFDIYGTTFDAGSAITTSDLTIRS